MRIIAANLRELVIKRAKEKCEYTGQATVRLLKFNTSVRILERQILINQGYYPSIKLKSLKFF